MQPQITAEDRGDVRCVTIHYPDTDETYRGTSSEWSLSKLVKWAVPMADTYRNKTWAQKTT